MTTSGEHQIEQLKEMRVSHDLFAFVQFCVAVFSKCDVRRINIFSRTQNDAVIFCWFDQFHNTAKTHHVMLKLLNHLLTCN